MRVPWEYHDQSQETNWRHCVTGPELPLFHKRKGMLKKISLWKCRDIGLVWELHPPTHRLPPYLSCYIGLFEESGSYDRKHQHKPRRRVNKCELCADQIKTLTSPPSPPLPSAQICFGPDSDSYTVQKRNNIVSTWNQTGIHQCNNL